jgi:hypothetical protein
MIENILGKEYQHLIRLAIDELESIQKLNFIEVIESTSDSGEYYFFSFEEYSNSLVRRKIAFEGVKKAMNKREQMPS